MIKEGYILTTDDCKWLYDHYGIITVQQEPNTEPEQMKDKAKVIFVSGAYRADAEWQQAVNISHAGFIARELWRRNWVVICPQKNTAYFGGLSDNPKDDFMIWLRGDLELLSRSDAIYMLKGWESSEGSHIEYNFAMNKGMKIYFESKGDLLK
jgi:hypothetical protein